MTNATLNTHQLVKDYGCTRNQLADKMRNNMHMPDEYLGALKKYRMLHLSGTMFNINLFDGLIQHQETNYGVIYHNCTPYSAKRAKELRLSFRAAHKEFMIEPLVLVEIVQEG